MASLADSGDEPIDALAPPLPQERLLLEAVQASAGERILCTSLGRAQLARALATARPHGRVVCWYLDQFRANLARAAAPMPANLELLLAADPPPDEIDLAAFPCTTNGEAELVRETLQEGHRRLRVGGILAASTDNAADRWLHDEMKRLCGAVTRRVSAEGAVYIARKSAPSRKAKEFAFEFAFRDRGRLIRAVSRPGVFSHRHVDGGARRLMEAMEVVAGSRVLDIGCGSGVVALAAACRAEGVRVHAVDSNARAVACTARGAELNGFANVTTECNAAGLYADAGSYDLALANPPYYASFRIAQLFIDAAHASLRPGGRLIVVSKATEWFSEHLPPRYAQVRIDESHGYAVAQGTKRG